MEGGSKYMKPLNCIQPLLLQLYGIISAKRDLIHVFSIFQIFDILEV